MNEEELKEKFHKLENVILVVFVIVVFFLGYTYKEENSAGLLACYISLLIISGMMVVGTTLTMSKDQVLEMYKWDAKSIMSEAIEFIEETQKTIKESMKLFFAGQFEDAWEKIKTFWHTRVKSIVYTPLAVFSLLGILDFFGYSITDEERGTIAITFTLFVVYLLQTAPLGWKKKGYIKNSLDKISEFAEIAKNSRNECELILNEQGKFVKEEWNIQHQIEQRAIENINNHNELVTLFAGSHNWRERVTPILTSLVGLATWVMRMAGVML